MVKTALSSQGFTLMELLLVVLMVGMVFLGGMSLYTSGLRFLRTQQTTDVTALPDVSVEDLARKTAVANDATLTQGGSQLNLELDYSQCSPSSSLNTPSDGTDDYFAHYRLVNNELLYLCNQTAATTLTASGNPAGTVVALPNLNTGAGGSTFQITNPSSAGSATVVSIHIVSTSPAKTLDTEVALGAAPKN